MEISSKENDNVDTAFLTMLKEIHLKDIEAQKNNKNNDNLSHNTLLEYKNKDKGCCG